MVLLESHGQVEYWNGKYFMKKKEKLKIKQKKNEDEDFELCI